MFKKILDWAVAQKKIFSYHKMQEPEDRVFDLYFPYFKTHYQEVASFGARVPIPKFSEEFLMNLFTKMQKVSSCNTPLVYVDYPAYVIGDLHGNLHDLLRILYDLQWNPDKRLVFLGDYVDRGSFSTEVITLLFSLAMKFPNRIFLLRGNHEFEDVCETRSVHEEMITDYSETLYQNMIAAFAYLPLAAVIGNCYLCVHGGLSPDLHTLDDIVKIQLPIFKDPKSGIISDILWSDPNKRVAGFWNSKRGVGKMFGYNVLREFLAQNNLQMLIRGHSYVTTGIEKHKDCITVFSSSYYTDEENPAGYLDIDVLGKINMRKLAPFQTLKRQQCNFQDADTILPQISHLPPLSLVQREGSLLAIRTFALKPNVIKPTTRNRNTSLHRLYNGSLPSMGLINPFKGAQSHINLVQLMKPKELS